MGASAVMGLAAVVLFVIAARAAVASIARFKAWLREERPGVYQELSVLPALADRRLARFLIKRHYRDGGDQYLIREAEIARTQLVRLLVVMAFAVLLALYALSR